MKYFKQLWGKLSGKHKKVMENIAEIEFDGEKLDADTIALINQLQSIGWDTDEKMVKLPPTFTDKSYQRVFVGQKFVVKKPYTVGQAPKLACPTKVIHQRKDSASFPSWVVQPVCKSFYDMSQAEIDSFVNRGLLEKHGGSSYTIPVEVGGGADCHHGNFGVLNGELVQFDW